MNARVRFRTDPAGVVEVPPRDHPVVAIHFGPSVYIHCRRGPWSHRGLGVHGDIDIIPAGIPARWEMKETDRVILLDVGNRSGVEIVNRFQIRDRQLESLGQRMKAEMDAGLSQWTLVFRQPGFIGCRTFAGAPFLGFRAGAAQRRLGAASSR